MIDKALLSLRPNSQWILNGDSYAGIEWLDVAQTKPTEQEIQTEIARLQADYDDKDYQRKRTQVYPSFADQFDLLYHGGYDAWKTAIQAVKDRYPKP
jgi:hypothetical protein